MRVNYSFFGITAGYNNIWGSTTSFGSGAIVSPYTYNYATDPLYTTGWLYGMVEKTAGSAYKIAPTFSFLDDNLVFGPSYEYFDTYSQPPSSEYDFTISYSIPEIKGLTIFGGYGYSLQSMNVGGNFTQGQIMVNYLY